MRSIKLDNLLLVDDEKDHAELIMKVLKEEEHLLNDIKWLKNGKEAVEYLAENNEEKTLPGLILLDIKMPFLNGFEVLEYLKKDKLYKKIPIVMLTTSLNTDDVNKALELGANDYIVKPVNWFDFEEKVRGIGKYWALISEATKKHN